MQEGKNRVTCTRVHSDEFNAKIHQSFLNPMLQARQVARQNPLQNNAIKALPQCGIVKFDLKSKAYPAFLWGMHRLERLSRTPLKLSRFS